MLVMVAVEIFKKNAEKIGNIVWGEEVHLGKPFEPLLLKAELKCRPLRLTARRVEEMVKEHGGSYAITRVVTRRPSKSFLRVTREFDVDIDGTFCCLKQYKGTYELQVR